ncbi:MAG: c-type cytochrome biogenesis protein CcmI [Gemmatimonadales bacterium]|nr:MAG: c-type cytochrome biogenesis protein CcmI [Gemmatimonadales bacterium]
MTFIVGIVLATLVVFWVLFPLVSGRSAPMERDEEELTEAQHRKRIALFALRDVEYDFHAGKLDEDDYRKMKREIASEALEALAEEEQEWAARQGRRAAEAERKAGSNGRVSASVGDSAVEEEIRALRSSLKGGIICRECGHPNPAGSRFCSACGSALAAAPPAAPSGSPSGSP